jgi:hypothetical protein
VGNDVKGGGAADSITQQLVLTQSDQYLQELEPQSEPGRENRCLLEVGGAFDQAEDQTRQEIKQNITTNQSQQHLLVGDAVGFCEIPEVDATGFPGIPEPGAIEYRNLMRQNPKLTRSGAAKSDPRTGGRS